MISFRGPFEWPCFLHDLEEWQRPFSELGDETPESGDASGKALHVPEAPWRLHLLDGPDLIGVCFDPPVRHQEPEQLAGRHPEDALVGVELDVSVA